MMEEDSRSCQMKNFSWIVLILKYHLCVVVLQLKVIHGLVCI